MLIGFDFNNNQKTFAKGYNFIYVKRSSSKKVQ